MFCTEADYKRMDTPFGRFGAYELHDLVVLDQHTVGVIVEISKEACKVCFDRWLSHCEACYCARPQMDAWGFPLQLGTSASRQSLI